MLHSRTIPGRPVIAMSMCFVTAMYDLYPEVSAQASVRAASPVPGLAFRLRHLERLLACDIDLVLFVSSTVRAQLPTVSARIRVIELALTDIAVYRRVMAAADAIQLPAGRNVAKDTLSYLAFGNCKTELVERAIALAPGHTHYAWIDGGILKVAADVEIASRSLEAMSRCDGSDRIVAPMGAYPPLRSEAPWIVDVPYWRFLGGLWIAPWQRMMSFRGAVDQCLTDLLAARRITWEVNVYAVIERLQPDLFCGFLADHDQSMLQIPKRFFAR